MRVYKAPGEYFEEIEENFTDIVLYCKSKKDLFNDLDSLGLTLDGEITFDHTPFQINKDGEILFLARLKDKELALLQNSKNIE